LFICVFDILLTENLSAHRLQFAHQAQITIISVQARRASRTLKPAASISVSKVG
jgi:hypothetical protein